jgi:hypothetical protein
VKETVQSGHAFLRVVTLAVAAGMPMIASYFSFTLAHDIGVQTGNAPDRLIRSVALAIVAGLLLVEPIGGFFIPRKALAAGGVAAMGVTQVVAAGLEPGAAYVTQPLAGFFAFAPLLLGSVVRTLFKTRARKRLAGGIYWGITYMVPATTMFLITGIGVRAFGLIWGLLLLVAAVVVLVRCPGESCTRPRRWFDPWLLAFGLGRRVLITWFLVVALGATGIELGLVDGYIALAMRLAGFDLGATLTTLLAIVVGVSVMLAGSLLVPVRLWVRVGGLTTFAGAWVLWAAASPNGFLAGRLLVEVGTSVVTVLAMLDPRTAALAQLAKTVGNLVGYTGGSYLMERWGWQGVAVASAGAAGVIAFVWVPRRRNRVAERITTLLWTLAERVHGPAVVARELSGVSAVLRALPADDRQRALEAALGVDEGELPRCDPDQAALALALSGRDARVEPGDDAIVLIAGWWLWRIRIEVGPGGRLAVRRNVFSRRRRLTGSAVRDTRGWNVVPVPGEHTSEDDLRRELLGVLADGRSRSFATIPKVPFLQRLVGAIESTGRLDFLEGLTLGQWAASVALKLPTSGDGPAPQVWVGPHRGTMGAGGQILNDARVRSLVDKT